MLSGTLVKFRRVLAQMHTDQKHNFLDLCLDGSGGLKVFYSKSWFKSRIENL